MQAARHDDSGRHPRFSGDPGATAPVPVDPIPEPTTELFRRCMREQRDRDWRIFLARCGSRIRKILARMARQFRLPLADGDLEEMVQDLYLSLLRASKIFNGDLDTELWAYLAKSCQNLVIDRWRYEHAAKRRHCEVLVSFDSRGGFRAGGFRAGKRQTPMASGPSPEESTLWAQHRRIFLHRCWQKGLLPEEGSRVDAHQFPPRLRARAVALVFVEGCTSSEASESLGGALGPRQVDAIVTGLRRRAARCGLELPGRREVRNGLLPEWID